MEIFQRHGDTRRAAAPAKIEVIDADWMPERLVLMSFPTPETARAWKDDPDDIALAGIRQASADTNMVLVLVLVQGL